MDGIAHEGPRAPIFPFPTIQTPATQGVLKTDALHLLRMFLLFVLGWTRSKHYIHPL